uniref:QcrA and Rieske domain-containing protein n=1 Tax=Pseudonocardia lacus TaxID=2835865 RepID=UPI001BDBD4F6
AAAAAGIAGCATSAPQVPPPTAPPSTAPGPQPEPQPGAVGSTGTPVAAAADVPVGGALVVESLELVVTQPEAGRFTGLSAICTHTGCVVNRVEGATLVCPCHGSRYGLDGSVQQGPAPRALDSRPVSVVDGRIVLE